MAKMQQASTFSRALENPVWALAKAISVVTSPAVLSFVSIYLMGVTINDPLFWRWGLVYALFGFVAPLAYLIYLMRKGEVSDFHMKERSERIKPMTFILIIFSSASLVFYLLDVPYVLQVFTYVGAVQAVVMLLITLRWKISGHGAGAAAFALLLWALFGPAAAPAFLLVPIVIWARVYTDRHDLLQTIIGAVAGFALMGLALALIAARCPGAGLACI
jgi:membrane-associated phospholipid phosphatase